MDSPDTPRSAPLGGNGPTPRWELYRLLSDPTRLRLLALTSIEELGVSELAELLREGQPKISRHAAALREAGLLFARKQGTWLLLRLAPGAADDAVVADGLATGLTCCTADGTTERVAAVVAARDRATREFFARGGRTARAGSPDELAMYLSAMAPLVSPRHLAVDAGTGDGALLEVLAPVFDHVIALDRSPAQLDLARARAAQRDFRNVHFLCGELAGADIAELLAELSNERPQRGRRRKCPLGADAVFAARVLHHAPVPARTMSALTALARPSANGERGGGVFVLDYATHRDEALQEQQADLWLGFDPKELVELAESAGLRDVERLRLPAAWCGEGPDRHLAWQLVRGWRGPQKHRSPHKTKSHQA